MLKNIVIYGAGGLGREILWLIESINEKSPTWKILGFLDDGYSKMCDTEINGLKVLGGKEWLDNYPDEVYVTCAIGKSTVRKSVYEKVSQLPTVKLATLIDPTVRVGKTVKIGEGSTICYNSILTVDISIGKGVLVNTGSSIGHDASISDYCTFYMGTMIAGNVILGECCEIGSGAFVLQGKTIVANTRVAPLTSVLTDIVDAGVYSGNPARKMR